MSLAKFRQGVQNIEPDDMTVKAVVDGRERSVIAVNKVKELVADREMAAYLIQVETESGWNRFDVQITDKDGSYGAAPIFNDRR
jgi:regulator of protease activity HflC (stomatin/prohibitin superfamily)